MVGREISLEQKGGSLAKHLLLTLTCTEVVTTRAGAARSHANLLCRRQALVRMQAHEGMLIDDVGKPAAVCGAHLQAIFTCTWGFGTGLQPTADSTTVR